MTIEIDIKEYKRSVTEATISIATCTFLIGFLTAILIGLIVDIFTVGTTLGTSIGISALILLITYCLLHIIKNEKPVDITKQLFNHFTHRIFNILGKDAYDTVILSNKNEKEN